MITEKEKSMKLLVVDDALDNRILLEAILEVEGFENICLAESAKEAYDYLGIGDEKSETDVDLILMDIMMPEITGIEAIREIRKHEHLDNIPIVIVSAKSETEDLVEAFEAGAVDYLTKPINELELLARLGSMLRLKRETDLRIQHEEKLLSLTKKLEDKNEHLSNVLEMIQDDLEAAATMQRSLLPPSDRKIESLNFKWFYEPCESIGGDLLNIRALDDENVVFYLMDVSGHGIQAAMLAVSVHRLLFAWNGDNSILKNADGSIKQPKQVITELNNEFMIQSNNFQYFTMTYGILNLKSRILTYTRAGQTPLLIQKPDGNLESFHQGDLPVGFKEGFEYKQFEIELEAGDRIFLYSDGITEARRENRRKFYGEERFYDIVQKMRPKNIEEAVPIIAGELFNWLGDYKPRDDITLLGIQLD